MNNNTPAAQELAQDFTVTLLREMIKDEFGVTAPSKLRKLELAQYLDDLRVQRGEAERAAVELDLDDLIEEEVDQTINERLAHLITEDMRRSAKAIAVVAWGHLRATVHSMGRLVHGKVVDTVLRDPGPDGMGRVCVVVQHDGHPTRRTLHRYLDVKFEALTS